jgi:iron(III) transport system ATP-binding protein
MISIRIQQLTKRFGAVTALDRVDLTINPGELFFLLGPSGCGKTTLLRTLAGFYEPDSGSVWFGDEEVTRLAPHKRNTGMMFQSYALWPHMTVAQNVAFGLEERKVPRNEIDRRVAQALESVHMAGYGQRRPNELSGGQQQRVALARALVVRPRCLLLDEPLSNLDAKLRLEMRAEIRRVAKEFRLTTVYVTHDQKEALSIADRIALLDGGHVVQVGTPQELYRRPRNTAVASFIGETDLLSGTVKQAGSSRIVVATESGDFEGVPGDPTFLPATGARVSALIRPECWRFASDATASNRVHGTIVRTTYLGDVAQHEVQVGAWTLRVLELNPRQAEAADRQVDLVVDMADVVILPAA